MADEEKTIESMELVSNPRARGPKAAAAMRRGLRLGNIVIRPSRSTRVRVRDLQVHAEKLYVLIESEVVFVRCNGVHFDLARVKRVLETGGPGQNREVEVQVTDPEKLEGVPEADLAPETPETEPTPEPETPAAPEEPAPAPEPEAAPTETPASEDETEASSDEVASSSKKRSRKRK